MSLHCKPYPFLCLLLAGLLIVAAAGPIRADDAPILSLDTGGHSAICNKVLFAPGGGELISVGDDKVIRVWDAATGEPLRTLHGPVGPGLEGALYAAALSPDGRTLAVGGYSVGNPGDIRLFDLRSGQVVRRLQGHTRAIDALAFSRDGSLLASGSGDNTVRLWNPATGECLKVLEKHQQDVYGVAFSPDGRQLASASWDRTVRVWSTTTGECLWTREHPAEVHCVAWSPDGSTIASGCWDHNIRLLKASTGAVRKVLPRQGNAVSCLAYSRDGRRLVSGSGGETTDYSVGLWAMPEGALERTFTGHNNTVLSAAFSPDGSTVASTGGNANEIILWDANTGKVLHRLAGSGSIAFAVGWSPDGSRLAWGNTSKVSGWNDLGPLEHTFDLTTGAPGSEVRPDEPWLRVKSRQAGREFTASADRKSLLVTTDGRETGRFTPDPLVDGFVRCFTFTPSGNIVVGTDFSLLLCDASGKPLRHFLGHTGAIWAVSVSPDGRYLASASSDQTVKVWPLTGAGDTVSPLLSLFRGSDGNWVAWTPEGYYACSPGGERLVGWQINRGLDQAADYYPAYQFRRTLYRPDVISRLLEAGGTAEAVRLADADRKQKTDPDRTVSHLSDFAPPRVEIVSPTAGSTLTGPEVTLRAHLTDPNGRKITAVSLLVNGRKVDARNLQRVPADQSIEWSGSTSLVPGENTLSLLAVNDAGAESVPVSVKVNYQAVELEKPALYVLAVGVSHYQNSDFNLRYPAKDASDFATACRSQQGKLFRTVEVKSLTDDAATRDGIEDGLDWLRTQVTQKDYAMVFVSGHGTSDSLNQYYYAPYGVDLDHLKRTGVVWSDFKTTLANLPGKVILVLDTCHAGGASGVTSKGNDPYTDVLRDAGSEDAGLITFASCLPREVSLEKPEWQNGAFTKALVEGMMGAADADHDGAVTLSELDTYITNRVKELTGGAQHPTTERPTTIRGSLPLAIVR